MRGLLAGELALVDQLVDQVAELEVGQLGGHLEHRLPRRQVAADLQGLGRRVEAVQHRVAEVDAAHDVHAVHHGQPVGQLAGELGAVHAHADGEVLGGGVELVQIVLPLIEVVAHFLVRHRDRPDPLPLPSENRSSVAAANCVVVSR